MPTTTDTPAAQLAGAIATYLDGSMNVELDGPAMTVSASGLVFTVTVTPAQATDPLAWVTGSKDEVKGKYLTGRGNPCPGPRHEGYSCTRPAGHPGLHVATYGYGDSSKDENTYDVCCEPWADPPEMTLDERLNSCSIGDPDPTVGTPESMRCLYDIRGDACTRRYRHSGQHVAGDGETVLDRIEQ